MKKKISILIALLLVASMGFSQTTRETNSFDYGTINDNVYKNTFFNFKIDIPEGWFVQSKEQTDMLVEAGKDLVTGDNENLKAVIKASEINSAYLLTVFKHELGSAVSYNPSFMVIAENLKLAPGVKLGSDYLFHTRNLLKQSQIKYSHMDDVFLEVMMGNREFHEMDVDLNHMGLVIKQSYYSTILNGFALSIVISYVSETEKTELLNTLKTLKFTD
ncbi:hypothetical protein PW52_14810 [Tamlana sedimentorum]|uniref:PsbP C-terminal domain-containing protein n=1 Tax=Neotamlana sedimentorum TaxID=1435349 RepID=A0A0D7W399_9FLAO|nr:hypothetical protein [Tamlana sedimentorum]KJD33193.1 hypothetical protein PW52_14810 [Tamlana sedimentorum]